MWRPKKWPYLKIPPEIPRFSFLFFADLEDTRRTSQGNQLYPLDEIFFLSIARVISGADTWTSISFFWKSPSWNGLAIFILLKMAFPPMMCWEKCLQPLIEGNSVNALYPGLILWHHSLPEKSLPSTAKRSAVRMTRPGVNRPFMWFLLSPLPTVFVWAR